MSADVHADARDIAGKLFLGLGPRLALITSMNGLQRTSSNLKGHVRLGAGHGMLIRFSRFLAGRGSVGASRN
jgi:hypothetical protein